MRRRISPAVLLRRKARPGRDTFTGADATNITAHTPDAGPAWQVLAGTWALLANQLRKSATDATHEAIVQDLGSPDVTVKIDLTIPVGKFGIVGTRIQDMNNAWIAQVDQAGANLKIFERAAGVFTQRASGAAAVPAATQKTLTMDARGSSVTATWGTDPSINYASAATGLGINQHGPWAYNTTVDNDNWEATP